MTPGPDQDNPTEQEPEAPQQLQGFMGNDEWDALLAHVNSLIRELESNPDEKIRKRVLSLLQGIDAIHREPLTRLVRLFKEGVLEKVVTDPPIHTLMELYDLLPAENDEEAEPPASPRPSTQRPFPNIPIRVEPTGATQAPPKPHPHWVPILDDLQQLGAGETRVLPADDRDLLLCRVDDRVFAMDPACARDGSTLAGATLNRYTLVCPAHPACYYDVRQGTRIGGPGEIRCYPVQIGEHDGRIMVGFGMVFEPKLPTF